MTMLRFIPTEEVKRLTKGSYEHLIARLEERIRESAEELFDADSPVHILGTFPGHVLVVSEDGRCARVKYEGIDSGTVKIVKVEEVDVPSYSMENLDEFLRSESRKVVDLFRKGDVAKGTEGLKGLALHANGWPSPGRQEETVNGLLKTISKERPWTRLFEARKDQIHRSLWGELRGIEESRLHPRFRKLYDGSTCSGDLEKFRSLIEDCFRVLGERLDGVAGLVKDARSRMQAATTEVEKLGEADALATSIAFSEDLLEDVSRIAKIGVRSSKQVRQVDSLGRLHDGLVERLATMEVAGHFVLQLSKRLS